jgi:hypothetical protein
MCNISAPLNPPAMAVPRSMRRQTINNISGGKDKCIREGKSESTIYTHDLTNIT